MTFGTNVLSFCDVILAGPAWLLAYSFKINMYLLHHHQSWWRNEAAFVSGSDLQLWWDHPRVCGGCLLVLCMPPGNDVWVTQPASFFTALPLNTAGRAHQYSWGGAGMQTTGRGGSELSEYLLVVWVHQCPQQQWNIVVKSLWLW